MSLFEEVTILGDHYLVEGEPWLRAIPLDKLPDRVIIRPLRTDRG